MFGRSKAKAPTLGDSVSDAAGQVRLWAGDVLQDSANRAAPMVDAVSGKLSDAAHRVGDAANDFQFRMQDDYIPTAAGQLAPYAGRSAEAIGDAELPVFVNNAITRVTGDKKSGRRLQKAAKNWAKDAEKQLKKRARKKNKTRRTLLVVGVSVAAAGAAYAVWRLSQPVEDPWTNPTPEPLSENE